MRGTSHVAWCEWMWEASDAKIAELDDKLASFSLADEQVVRFDIPMKASECVDIFERERHVNQSRRHVIPVVSLRNPIAKRAFRAVLEYEVRPLGLEIVIQQPHDELVLS